MADKDVFEEHIRRKKEKSAAQGGPKGTHADTGNPADQDGPLHGAGGGEWARGQQGAGADPGGNPARREGIPPHVS